MKRSCWNPSARRPRHRNRSGLVRLEQLEPRVVLAGDLILAEVMTSNNNTIDDEDGVPSDWFEVYNSGNETIDLAGWHVTDDTADRTKWTFPSLSLAPGESRLVFASNKDRRDPAGELHTNFALAEGEYLALFEPDGRTVSDAYQVLPEQYEDVSYGWGQVLQDRELVAIDGPVSAWLPTAADQDVPTATWTAPGYDDAGWNEISSGVGYDDDPTDGDFNPLISASGNLAAAMQGQTASAYFRAEFDLPETLPTFKSLDLKMNYDDGFIAYLNGREIARANAPDAAAWDSTAAAEHGGIAANVSYEDFASADAKDDYTLLGNASWNGDRLALTTPAVNQNSAAWLTRPIAFGSDYTFSASMVYDIHTPGGTFADSDGLGGEGMVFVLQSNDNNVLGLGGGGLGIDNTGSTFLAIELDSVATGSFDPDDSLPSHLGVTTNAQGSVERVRIPRFNGNAFFAGQPGPGVNLIYLWVEYNGLSQQLDVYMSSTETRPDDPTLTTSVNLTELFGGDPQLYAGWTASTSDAFNGHDVLSWNILTGVGELGREAESFSVSAAVDALVPGKNVLAIHALNASASDEDFLMVPQLTVQEVILGDVGYFLTPSPGELNGPSSLAPSGSVRFSRDSQIFVDPFNLELIAPMAGATVYYTLDGTVPDETSEVYTAPISIEGPVRVRARAVEAGRALGPVTTAGFTQLSGELTNFEGRGVFDSNLPIIVMEGFGKDPRRQSVRLQPTVGYFIQPGADGRASLLDVPQYTGRAGLRIRGQSSEGWAKRQYALEMWSEGTDDSKPIRASDAPDRNVGLFGLPADSDWVLNGPYSDKTQLNNFLTFNWYREIGIYAPRAMLVEVFMNADGSQLDFNEDYQGTYVLLEKIKIDQNRVDITQIQPGDNQEPEITGGYIWKKDKSGAGERPFNTAHNRDQKVVDPQDPVSRDEVQPGEISPEQKEWLISYIEEFEDVLYGPNFADPKEGYQKYIDVDSWIDTWLMVEFTKNIDGFRLSTYYYKDRGGKIQQGPAWDYNLSLGNGNYLKGSYPEGWYKDAGLSADQYPYWARLFEDPNFAQQVSDRWTELRQTIFTTENMLADIDAAVNSLSDGNPNLTNPAPGEPSNPISRNYDRWTRGGYGESIYHWPNCFFGQGDCPASPLPAEMTPNGRPNSYDDYIYIMKWFVENRLAWMDSQLGIPLNVSPPSGVVDPGTQVTLAAPDGFDVFYTLDGSDPRQPLIIEEESVILPAGSPVQYHVPTDDTLIGFCDDGIRLTTPDSCFVNVGYQLGTNGETWSEGTLPIGYDADGDYTPLLGTDVQASMQGVNSSMYLRIPFTVDAETLDRATKLKLSARYDDGFVAYLWYSSLKTPIEVARANGGSSSGLPIRALSYNATATETHPDEEATGFVDFDITSGLKRINAGETNYLVIQALNESAASPDFLMDFQLTVGTERVEVAPGVKRYDGPLLIDRNSQVIARGYNAAQDEWTPVALLTYLVDSPAVTVTEINYNPYDPTEAEIAAGFTDNEAFEFVELKNVGSATASLVGVEFDGFDLVLGDVELAPGEYGVVVRNTAAFTQRYGSDAKILGEFFGGALDNAGETIRVLDTFGTTLVDLAYSDAAIWPQAADGDGATLQLLSPDTTPSDQYGKYYSWEASVEYGGSPGRAGAVRPGVLISEILAHTDPPVAQTDSIELYNTTDAPIDISGWFLSDAAGNLTKYQIPANTILAPGQYLAFDESQFNADPNNGFALSSYNGDDVWLTIADAERKPVSIVDHVRFLPSLNGESFGRDARGWLTPVQSITLGAANADPRVGPVVISEVNYNPSEPTAADLAIHPEMTSGDLEFIEIHNPTDAEVSLEDWRIRGGVDFNFEPSDKLAARETVVVVRFNPDSPDNAARLAAFRNHYGLTDAVRLLGGYSGGLSNNGERITLLSTDLSLVGQGVELPRVQEDEVVFDDRVPWPVSANGGGDSLHRLDPTLYGNAVTSWLAEAPSPGLATFTPVQGDFDGDGVTNVADITLLYEQLQSPTPDSAFDLNGDGSITEVDRDILVLDIIGTTYGDADLDRVFDSADLVRLMQLGEYEDGIPGNSTWDEGDFNGDGDFDASDLILAQQYIGRYVPVRAEPAPAIAGDPNRAAIAALQADRLFSGSEADESTEAGKRMAVSSDEPSVDSRQLEFAEFDQTETRELTLLDRAGDGPSELDDELLELLAGEG